MTAGVVLFLCAVALLVTGTVLRKSVGPGMHAQLPMSPHDGYCAVCGLPASCEHVARCK